MKTMINIRADRDVKEKAQQTARALGLPLSTIINAYLKQFVRTRTIVFSLEGELKPAVKRRLAKLHSDVVAGRNLSPAFINIQEMDAYLNSLGE